MGKQLFAIASLSLIVLTIVNLSQAQIERDGKCPQVKVMQNFDPKSYAGKWVVYEAIPGVLLPETRCLHSEYVYHTPTEISMAYKWIDNAGNKPNGTSGIGVIKGPGHIEVQVPFWHFGNLFQDYILSTDYKTYATVLTCDETLRGTHIMLLTTLLRSYSANPTAQAKSIAVMKANNLPYNLIKKKDMSNCPAL